MRTSSATWRGAAVTGFAFLLMALGGCGSPGDVEPAETPPSASTSSPSPSQTPEAVQPPEQPAAMSEPTTEGAIAAATYVLELFTYTFASGDTGPWGQITRSTCVLCAGVITDVERMAGDGYLVRGARITIDTAQATEIAPARWYGVDMKVTQAPSDRLDRDGETVDSDEGGTYAVSFALSWDERWYVDEFGIEPVDPDGTQGG